ncbi:hypothetical protein Bca101_007796 [Brassica carinata]
MANFNLASLPPSMRHKILSKVATNHLRDFKEYFYQSADLIGLNDWIEEVHAVRTFRHKCYQSDPQAIYLRGMYEFFVLHLLDEEREKICFAGEKGFFLAKYVDGMLNLAFSVDDIGLVHNYPSFGRECVDRMDRMIATSICSGHWGYEKPDIFMSLLERIDPSVSLIVVSGNVQLGSSAMKFI